MTFVYTAIGLLIVVMLGGIAFSRANPSFLARHARLIAAFIALTIALVAAIAGRVLFAIPVALIGALLFFGPARSWQRPTSRARRGTGGQSSSVASRSLRMSMDHQSGGLEGEVLAGPYEGRSFASLSEAELLDIRLQCERDDPEGIPLVEAYLDMRHPNWREDAGNSGSAGATEGSGSMDREAALEILGLEEGASEADIRAAHKRLMKKVHPDQGGSDFLAGQINAAKDCLLGS